jgi:DinB superfamily
MARAAVETLLYLLDEAYDSGPESLLANVRSLTADDWSYAPEGASRTPYEILWHVAACKWMYDHHAFGEAVWTWPGIEAHPPAGGPPLSAESSNANVASLLSWTHRGQQQLRAHVASLDDAELLAPRRANWGRKYETRWLIKVMIEHDAYHSGEINHLRSLHHGDDRWAHDK